ncbi:hypothetical protein [Pseudooceanicola sp.]|uniref:hypothetical protein n=1 Tax=Pseudooceanicola sp. TaxID=1914328 RepID=UPI004058A861
MQITKDRRLSVYPDEFGPEQDICDVTLWLQGKFGVRSLHLWVDRHYTQIGHEIAGVTVIARPGPSMLLGPAAKEAFLALGYLIEDTGADIYALQFCNGRHSRHEALHAYARIEAALTAWRGFS